MIKKETNDNANPANQDQNPMDDHSVNEDHEEHSGSDYNDEEDETSSKGNKRYPKKKYDKLNKP